MNLKFKKGYTLALLRYTLGIDEKRVSALKGIFIIVESLRTPLL